MRLAPVVSNNFLTQEINSQLEQEVTLEGNFSIAHGDNFKTGKATDDYILTLADGSRVSLFFAKGQPPFKPLTKVRVKGVRLGNEMALDSPLFGNFVDLSPNQSLLNNLRVLGTQNTRKIGVVLMNFQNDTTQPVNANQINSYLFGDTNNLNKSYKEQSFNKLSFTNASGSETADVFGYVTVSYNNNTGSCTQQDVLNWANDANNKAHAQNPLFSPHNYDTVIYWFNENNDCNYFGGLTYLSYYSPDKPYTNIGATNPNTYDYVWINNQNSIYIGGTPTQQAVSQESLLAHELGHSIGLYHAKSLSCKDASGNLITYTDTASNCSISEYGDWFDTMGQTGKYFNYNSYPHFNNYHKGDILSLDTSAGQKSWWNSPNTADVSTSNGTYTYTLYPIEQSSNNLQALRIKKNDTRYYYLEFRQSYGFDNFNLVSPNEPVTRGVTIRLAPDYLTSTYNDFSELLNMHPANALDTMAGLQNSPLVVGESYTDPGGSIKITTSSVNTSGNPPTTTVQVVIGNGGCTHANPDVSISPTSSAYVDPGVAVNYTVSVKNNDTSSCGSSTFNVTPTLPGSGWSQSPNPGSVNVNPGSTGSVNVTVTSLASAAGGSYTITETATNQSATSYSGSTTATYNISSGGGSPSPSSSSSPSVSPSPSAGGIPAAPTNLSASAGTGVVNLSWSAVSGATSYNIYRGANLAQPALYKTGITTNSYTDTNVSLNVYYGYQVTAVNSSGESGKSSQAYAYVTQGSSSPSPTPQSTQSPTPTPTQSPTPVPTPSPSPTSLPSSTPVPSYCQFVPPGTFGCP